MGGTVTSGGERDADSGESPGDGTGRDERAAGRVPVDDLFQILSRADRRRALCYLVFRESAALEELADVVAGWQATTESAEIATAEDRRRVLSALTHSHVPRLVDAGVVAYDEGRGVVRIATDDPLLADAVEFSLAAARRRAACRGEPDTGWRE